MADDTGSKSGYFISGAALFVSFVMAITGWQIGRAVTNEVGAMREEMRAAIVRFTTDVSLLQQTAEHSVKLGTDNQRINEVQAEILRRFGENITDHETRIRSIERLERRNR